MCEFRKLNKQKKKTCCQRPFTVSRTRKIESEMETKTQATLGRNDYITSIETKKKKP